MHKRMQMPNFDENEEQCNIFVRGSCIWMSSFVHSHLSGSGWCSKQRIMAAKVNACGAAKCSPGAVRDKWRGSPKLPRSTWRTHLGNYHWQNKCSLPSLASVPRAWNSRVRQLVRLPIAFSLHVVVYGHDVLSTESEFFEDAFITEYIKQMAYF